MGYYVGYWVNNFDLSPQLMVSSLLQNTNLVLYKKLRLFTNNKNLHLYWRYESPRVHRRPVCLSQATLPDSFKLS